MSSTPAPSDSFYRRHSWLIMDLFLVSLPLVLLWSGWAMKSNRNNVKEWLPDTFPATQDVKWFHERFPGEGFVLITWDGCTFRDPRLPALVERLLPRDPDLAASEPASWIRSVRTGPQLVELLMDAPCKLSREEAMLRLEGLFVGQGANPRSAGQDQSLSDEEREELRQARIESLRLEGDDRPTCAVVSLSHAGADHLRQAVDHIRSTAESLGQDGVANNPALVIPRASIKLGGPPVDNVALDKAGEASLHRLVALSFGVGLVLSWCCFRNVQLAAYVFITGLYANVLSLSIVYLTGGSVNAVLLTMPTLVYVAATSGAIHLTNYYRETVLAHGVQGAALRAVRHAALPLGLATGTTAVGLATLCISDLLPIRMFGYYSAAGVVATLIPLIGVLPAAFELWPWRPPAAPAANRPRVRAPALERLPWNRWGEALVRRNGLVLLASAALLGFFGYGLFHCQTSVHLMRFFAQDSEIVQHYTWLERNLGPLVPLEVVLEFDEKRCDLNLLERMELVERVQQRINAHPEVGSSLSALTFAPDLPGGSGYSIRRATWAKRLERHKEDLIGSDYLRVYDGRELWRISARVGSLNYLDYGVFLAELRAVVDPVLSEAQGADGEGLASARFTGLIPLVYQAQHTLLADLIWGFIGDWFTIAAALMIVVRAWSAGLLLMLPSVFPTVMVFGYMGWAGIVVDIGTVMTPAVALGVTVDDVVHFMLRFRQSLREGRDRPAAIMDAYRGTAQAMYQSWGIIGLGLSVFALSPFMPTQRFGAMMIALLTAALVGNLILLPALLASPLGALFSWRIERQRRAAGNAASAPLPSMHRRHAARRETTIS